MPEQIIYHPDLSKRPDKKIRVNKDGLLLTPNDLKEQRENQDHREQQ